MSKKNETPIEKVQRMLRYEINDLDSTSNTTAYLRISALSSAIIALITAKRQEIGTYDYPLCVCDIET